MVAIMRNELAVVLIRVFPSLLLGAFVGFLDHKCHLRLNIVERVAQLLC